MIKQLLPIGSREVVSFPEMDIADVPAKVDTGADYSSIWASDIIEADGELSFVLFAPGSRYYTGEQIKTTQYSLTFVRSSFGHSQERYKVKLLTRIRSKKIRVEFTLADRSNNRFPILIGKRTLLNRFVVDVTQDGVRNIDHPARVLVMGSSRTSKLKPFFDEITASDPEIECEYAIYEDIRFDIVNNIPTCSVLSYGKTLADYDLIYFKTYFKNAEIAAAMAEAATASGVKFIDKEVGMYHARTKLTQYVRLARYGVNVPDSIVMTSQHAAAAYDELRDKLGDRFIMKDVASEMGEANYLITSQAEFDSAHRQGVQDSVLYVFQRYVENDGDYRVIVLDKTIELIIKRTNNNSSTHLTNTSKGGNAERISVEALGSEATTIAVRASSVMNRQVAGVDLVFDKNEEKWLVFEVNNSPQMVGGSYPKEKLELMGRFLKTYAKN